MDENSFSIRFFKSVNCADTNFLLNFFGTAMDKIFSISQLHTFHYSKIKIYYCINGFGKKADIKRMLRLCY